MRIRPRALIRLLPTRVFILATAMICVVLGLAYASLAQWSRRESQDSMRRGLEQSADLVAQFLAGRQRSLVGGARVFVQGPYFRAIVAARRRDDILDQSFEAAAQLDADWVFVVDERGILLAKSDEPGASGTDLGGIALVRGALRGQVTSGFGVSRDSLLFQATAIPIAVPGGAPIGVLVATKIVDSVLARDVKAVTASDIVFFSSDVSNASHVAASTLPAPLAKTLMRNVGVAHGPAASVRSHAMLDGRAYSTLGGGLTTAGGEAIGGFLVLRQEGIVDGSASAVRRALAYAALAGLLLAGLAALLAWRMMAAPLQRLTSEVDRATEESAFLRDISSYAGEELGRLSGAVHALVREFGERRDLARVVATTEVPSIPAAMTEPQPGARAARIGRRGIVAIEQRGLAAPVISPAGLLASGAVVGRRYRIEATLDVDAAASVYRALDEVSGHEVAIKVLATRHATMISASGERALSHRNIVIVQDAGEYEERKYLVLEYVDGRSLASLLADRERLTERTVIAIGTQVCRAMQAALEAGVTHGALTPRKLLLGRDGVLKVSGYHTPRGGPGDDIATPRTTPRIVGATVGAPQYMAPEQLLGATADVQSDLYAAGVILGECLSGNAPSANESPMAFLADRLNEQRAAPGVPHRSGLLQVIASMTESERGRRPAAPSVVLELLERIG